MACRLQLSFVHLLLAFLLHSTSKFFHASASQGPFDYRDALSKSILFFEAQRSGWLPPNQRVKWRSHSGLHDGMASGIDLVGGYYDAGDNVKFGLPMAFTITMLSWSVYEYKIQIAEHGELRNALDAIRWGTDYFLKAHQSPSVLWAEVGDGVTDHACWQRPEDMTTPRQAYVLNPSHPGSDLAGETAAAMAAASIAFQNEDQQYSERLLAHARQLFYFADRYQGKYSDSIPIAKNFYASRSGYNDELLWAAGWLYLASNDRYYLDYFAKNAEALEGSVWGMKEFSWDVKFAGVQVLATKLLLDGKGGPYKEVLEKYRSKAEYYVCACLQHNNGGDNVKRTPAGFMYIRDWNNMQYVSAGSFLLTVYSDYLSGAKQTLHCPARQVSPSEILSYAEFQVNYILGANPKKKSYMVGFGSNYPQQVHHRASSIVSIKQYPRLITCKDGYNNWYSRGASDPNVLVGALVGGPDATDNFGDGRHNWQQTEPTTYNTAPLVGIFARLSGDRRSRIASHSHHPRRRSFRKSATLTDAFDESFAAMGDLEGSKFQELVKVTQTMTRSWEDEGRTFFRYRVTVTNKSDSTIENLVLRIENFCGDQWGLTRTSEDEFTFPSWLQELAAGESFSFLYIQDAPPAEVVAESFSTLV